MNSHWTLIISVFISLAFMLMMAPGLIQLNKGKMLQNIIIWLVLFVLLGAAYKFFGPEGQYPLIHNNFSVMDGEIKVRPDEKAKAHDSAQTPEAILPTGAK